MVKDKEYRFGSIKTYKKESQAPNIFTRGNNIYAAQKNFSFENHPSVPQGIAIRKINLQNQVYNCTEERTHSLKELL